MCMHTHKEFFSSYELWKYTFFVCLFGVSISRRAEKTSRESSSRTQWSGLLVLDSESVSSLVMSEFANPWTVACQAPLSMGFSRQEYWPRVRFPSLGDLPYPGIKTRSPELRVDSLPSEPNVDIANCLFKMVMLGLKFLFFSISDFLIVWSWGGKIHIAQNSPP